jgi:hypothetical protein
MRSQDALAGPYLVSVTVVVVYCNTVARLRFRPALVLDSLVVAMYFYGWWHLPNAPVTIMAPGALTLKPTGMEHQFWRLPEEAPKLR